MPVMVARMLVPAVAALAAAALAAAPAAAQQPLAGSGKDLQPVARVPMDMPNEVELAGDWAFVSNDQAGLWIINIADPTKPYVQGKWECEAGWGDVDISPDANLAVLTNAHGGNCLDEPQSAAIIDTSDKSDPKLLSYIPDYNSLDYVHTSTLDDDLLYLNPQVAATYPQRPARIEVFDISDPREPVRKAEIGARGIGLAHDTYIDHRPDGRDLMYAASVHQTDVFDVTDPTRAELLQQMFSPEITISHDVQPNHDRTMIVVDDEGYAASDENASVCGRVGGPGPAAVDSGSVHFYAAAPDGTFANAGLVELGSWSPPAQVSDGPCAAHVFWQAPDENRLTQAYYGAGAFVLDFENPADVSMLGSFVAEGGSNYWSAKPHRGYLFATSMDHGLDILRYTGEGGRRWPATAGPAEIQRSARQGVPYRPIPVAGADHQPLPTVPADERRIGRVRFTARLRRVPGRAGRKVPIRIVFRDRAGKRVATLKVRRRAGRRARVGVVGGAVAGRYRWKAVAGRRTLGRGRITVRPNPDMKLSPGRAMAVTAR